LQDLLEQVTDNTSVASYFSAAPQSAQPNSTHLVRRLIVMDEVDGMSAGEYGQTSNCLACTETKQPDLQETVAATLSYVKLSGRQKRLLCAFATTA
jgi:hypothetical protein